MAWTTPRTYVAGEIVTSTILNTHVRDNLNALKEKHRELVAQRAFSWMGLVNQAWNYVTHDVEIIDDWGGFGAGNIFAAFPPGGWRCMVFAEAALTGQSGSVDAGLRIIRANNAGVPVQYQSWFGPAAVAYNVTQAKLSLAAFVCYAPGDLCALEVYVEASGVAGSVNFASMSILDYGFA
jgi:hypothetical protein